MACVAHTWSVPLDTVFTRSDSCIAVTWTPDSINTRSTWYIQNGSLCTGADSVYRHCDFIPGVTYRSIAYSYGGEDPYCTFSDKIYKGFLAGSHLCHYESFGDPSPAVAGTDCSGFICYVWGVPRVATGTLAASRAYDHIARKDLLPGDILVRSGYHAVLVVDKDDSTHLLIRESTSAVNGCREREIDLGDSYWSTYIAVRNPSINGTGIGRNTFALAAPMFTIERSGGNTFRILFLEPAEGTFELINIQGRTIITESVNRTTREYIFRIAGTLPRGLLIIHFTGQNGKNASGCMEIGATNRGTTRQDHEYFQYYK